ncbi:MAG: hypothetical protein ACREQL_09715, partial [Candidatus Binatia bacterium]
MTAVVAGIGQTRFARRSGATEMALAAGAITAALRDAGLAPRDVDGVVRFDRDAMWEYDLPGVLSLPALHFYNAVPFGPGSAPALLRMAAMAVTQGLATTVLAFHARDGRVRATPSPALEAALLARRFGIGEREIAAVTLAHRRAAASNPRALVRRLLTAATRRESAYVAEPLRRVDLAAPAAGACALVVTDEERARSSGRRPIRILGSLQAAI